MEERLQAPIDRAHESQEFRSPAQLTSFVPRLWMLLIVCFVPFLIMTVNVFEKLERAGDAWEFAADILLPATNIAYVILTVVLKIRKI